APQRRHGTQATRTVGHPFRRGAEAAGEAVPQPALVRLIVFPQAFDQPWRQCAAIAATIAVLVSIETDRPTELTGEMDRMAGALLEDATVVEHEGLDLDIGHLGRNRCGFGDGDVTRQDQTACPQLATQPRRASVTA